MLEEKRTLSRSAPGGLGVGLGRLAAVGRDVPFDLPLELLNPLLLASILFNEQFDLGSQFAVLRDQEGNLRCLVSKLLGQLFASPFLRHAPILLNCQPDCHLSRGR